MLTVKLELDICHPCAVVLVNGDDSADPERAERAAARAAEVYGDLRNLIHACNGECDESQHEFTCDYCGEDGYTFRHVFEILG